MPRILIADDNPSNADLLDAHLDGTEFETKVVSNGEEAIAVAREWKPDLILLDVMMPRLSGFEVCSRLRADPATREIAILMITALDQSSDVGKAVEAGTDDFITKPINKTELLLRVRALLASRTESNEVDRTLAYMGRVLQGL
ncbi:MAG: response regulator [Gemmataceae bacterium]|nr:response regulator [Gemmata sp.]MDW8199044.1 response regulator [Gemmataceae bacterium]